jgi:hypothetical protein
MQQGNFVFTQAVSVISWHEFNKSLDKYDGNYRAKNFKCWQQFLYMKFCQLTYRKSIRYTSFAIAHEHKFRITYEANNNL